MADDKHSSLFLQVIAGLITAAFLTAVSFVPEVLKWTSEVATYFWKHLSGTTGLPNWGLYLLAVLSIHTVVNLTARVIKPKTPSNTVYNNDTFLGLKWRWSYISGHPENVWAFCPHCDTMLVYSEIGSFYDPDRKTVLTCETCGCSMLDHKGDKDYLVQK